MSGTAAARPPPPPPPAAGGSAIPRFYELDRAARVRAVAAFAGLTAEEEALLAGRGGGISFEDADRMVENAVGTFSLPLAVATNFRINGRDVLVPMVTEEPSVVAAASKGAKAARAGGGFSASAGEPVCTGQIQVVGAGPPSSFPDAAARVREASPEILEAANARSGTLSGMGRGARSVSCRMLRPGGEEGDMALVVELEVDVADAMGANVTNSMCEAAAPVVERAAGGRALLRILSNYSTARTARAEAVFPRGEVGGAAVVDDMLRAYRFARDDVYRAVTHNKGVMNGCAAAAAAAGQDGRAVEAAAHAYAARGGAYRSLTEWSADGEGNLVGSLEIPLAVGTVGGVAGVHPLARLCLRILGASSSRELACAIASAGLAQNYAAMRALCTEGIQRGHMRLHARNLAAAAGARSSEIDRTAEAMIREGRISLARAAEILGGA